LWDNYSITKFGDINDYKQINQFKLYDLNGKEGGLTASYLTDSDPTKVFCQRTEQVIDYENLETIKRFPKGFKFGGSTILWEGNIEPSESGIFRFILYYAGYTKVYLNHELVVPERWRTAWNPNSYKFSVLLKKGERVPLKIEWKPDGGAYIGLKALSPVPDKEQNKLSFWSEIGNQINYYFIYGNSMDKVISGYRNVTGKAPIMPNWAMGFWQSRERYKTQDEIVGALREFRKRQIPIDNIVMDWSYWKENQWGSHEFDPARFSNATKMIQDIHNMNGHIMISVWPKFYPNTDHYKELDAKGYIYKQAINDSVRDWIGHGYIGSFYDPYSAEARSIFWRQMREHLYNKGIDAWWMDASEPDILSNASIQYRKKLCNPTALGSSSKYFNTYALMNAQAIYEGQRSVDPNKRVFLLTRSGFAGLQRYSTATWSGDIGTRWEDMKAQISAGLNFSMSGIPYWTMDIGGFCVEHRYENAQREYDKTGVENADLKEWRELNTRWYQFGSFAPLFRAHGQFPFREVYNIAPEDHPAYKSIVYYDKLRYRLMPYIYSLAGMTYHQDYTIMRALVMDFQKDTHVNNISDQYMFGPSIMVCPVYKYGATDRDVYFPSGTGWYDFYKGQHIEGGQLQKVEAHYERIPLYVCEGSIIPFGPEIQYVGEKKLKEITLYVYAGKNGSFQLYEDEGVNYNYEKGDFSKIRFDYNDKEHSLTIQTREGSFDGILKERIFNVILVKPNTSKEFDPDAKGIVVNYDGTKQTIML
jgi:Alpha-glucosidases, family 31 of glycosyl hydrolases